MYAKNLWYNNYFSYDIPNKNQIIEFLVENIKANIRHPPVGLFGTFPKPVRLYHTSKIHRNVINIIPIIKPGERFI